MTTPLDFRLTAFLTADHAEVVNGKLYINGGGWTRLFFPNFPQVLPSMAVVAMLEVPFGKYNAEHRFRLGVVDPDHSPLPLRIEGTFRVGATPEMEYGDPTLMPIAIPIHNLQLPAAGDYVFTIAVDDVELGRYSVRAVQIPTPLQFSIAPIVPPEAEAS